MTAAIVDHCGDEAPHERHEWLAGVRRLDCPGTPLAELELRYVVADGSANGQEVRVPLHECEIVRGDRKVAAFRQNGWFTTGRFVDDWPAYWTDEVEDLGDA